MSDSVTGDTHCECEDEGGPCEACRREIHESWHARGWFWIRPEECTPSCPGWPNDDLKRWQAALSPSPRDRAAQKQRRAGGPFRPKPYGT